MRLIDFILILLILHLQTIMMTIELLARRAPVCRGAFPRRRKGFVVGDSLLLLLRLILLSRGGLRVLLFLFLVVVMVLDAFIDAIGEHSGGLDGKVGGCGLLFFAS